MENLTIGETFDLLTDEEKDIVHEKLEIKMETCDDDDVLIRYLLSLIIEQLNARDIVTMDEVRIIAYVKEYISKEEN